ncbi:methyltransferase domain-containing protein [Flavobacterium johnsoniae]|uniref:Trans-aconitate 2-methyltransferase n=1 Tax=Flavobacterium johnsoniae (strain ATCC 17061 / DSM 2064 / JCM 8514 / BCRC 14874 / CCUG 350202 / NBRC 14942 / NCIMB 11054 / UW101) TaxID=376686 RepID=A5FCX3_FLAJ1|nr:methyltransferase domain-containing protein [Flavobacterium johnsoniae]ABQ06949.1 Trans-aconitate 2-methyltransferase [Flavobacterium johnsoniae UW101]OXE97195.1 trans-aconitate methyltransferase [Flavobacterium johnsoniae UW101]WQG81217.1 methyltransferase domain-containing protein [Flavobacterium johnsoniae UW101]SHL35496.1 trans-aconitate 2-methyltransferase [Flavobacterium johnsoniae]
MPWNPEIYNTFKDIRYKPFYDLADLIKPVKNKKAIDLGCGTGEQTAILADKFKEVHFLGVDSSAEMLEKSKALETENLHFRRASTEEMIENAEKWDLIFSNAALQWSNNHEILFPKLIHLLNSKGQFAVQMPMQPENKLNKILIELVNEEPFKTYLKGFKRDSPVLSIDEYAQILFDSGLEDIQIMQKVYPIIANDHDTLYNFISGSALIPYMEKLEGGQKELFIKTYKERIAESFPKLPAIYSFKRLLLYGTKA